jgi:hypothetical protein
MLIRCLPENRTNKMKIESKDTDIRNLLSSGFFYIPRFQRPYSWEKDNVTDFWDDLTRDTEQPYFIGPLVLYRSGSQRFAVVDGQQRLTTITLLLCALRQELFARGFSDYANALNQLIERQTLDAKNQYVLDTETSYPYFQNVIQRIQPDASYDANQSEERLIEGAYSLIKARLQEWTIDIVASKAITASAKRDRIGKLLIRLRDAILNLRIVEIVLDEEEDAYEIFETLNTKGKDLSLQDLVKTHFARKIPATNEKSDDVKLKWRQLVDCIEKEHKIKRERTDKDRHRAFAAVDTYLHHFWLSRYQYLPAKKIYKPLKAMSIKQTDAKQLLLDLLDDAKRYRMVIRPVSSDWTKNEQLIFDHLQYIAGFDTTLHSSFSLALVRAYRLKSIRRHTQISNVFRVIENFTFLTTALTQKSGSGISQMYASCARSLFEASNNDKKVRESISSLRAKLRDRIPGAADIDEGFRRLIYTDQDSRDKKLVKYVLERFHSFFSPGVCVDFESMTIEHLLSQSEAKSLSMDDAVFGSIGNLLLVTQEINAKLADRSFQEKKQILSDSNYPLDELIKSKQEWGPKEIAERNGYLSLLGTQKIWKI